MDPTQYQRLEYADPRHAQWFVVNWCLGNTCQYSCDYCPKALHDGSSPWPSKSAVLDFCNRLMAARPDRRFYFEFTGGEVTLWRDLPDVLAALKAAGADVGIISNGGRTLRWWDEAPELDHLCLSFHPRQADPYQFYKTVELMRDRTTLHVNCMMHTDKVLFQMALGLATQILSHLPDVSVALQPLVVDFGTKLYQYSPEQQRVLQKPEETIGRPRFTAGRSRKIYRGHMQAVAEGQPPQRVQAHELIAAGHNNWAGWDCWAGSEQLVIEMGGNILRGWCREGGVIGNISDPDLPLALQPVRCRKQFCHCNFDIMCSKERPNAN